MLIPIDTLKAAMGLPLTADPQIDPVLARSSANAQALVEAWAGRAFENQDADPKTHTLTATGTVRVVRLDDFPVDSITGLSIDGVLVPEDQYTKDVKHGMVVLHTQRGGVKTVSVEYVPGYTTANVPSDLALVITNIAIQIYESGGSIPVPSASSGELKSVTIFDAMSMSFDTGGSSDPATAAGPRALLEPWLFVLNKYASGGAYTMGS